MNGRFKFQHGGVEYEVFGEFGSDKKFSVVKFVDGATRMTRNAASPPGSSGMQVLAVVWSVDTPGQLKLELEHKYPGLTELEPF